MTRGKETLTGHDVISFVLGYHFDVVFPDYMHSPISSPSSAGQTTGSSQSGNRKLLPGPW